MTSTANELSWIKEADAMVSTYRAEANGWKYTADQPRKGYWVLRGWGPDYRFLYLEDTTLKGAKAQAADHQADLSKTAKVAKLAPAFIALDEGMKALAGAVAPAAKTLRHLAYAMRIPQPCGCPTPTHRMSCSIGAVPKVVDNHWSRLIAAESSAQRSGRMVVRQPELTVIRKGSAL